MRILKNQSILQRQSENYIKGELSNVAAVVQTPQLLTEFYLIDVDSSPTMEGFKNVEDFIDESSHVVYNLVHDVPMSGIDNLVTQAKFDEELGFDEDLQSSGIIFPNTIFPTPNCFFTIKGSEVTALYVVTEISPTTVRSNPFLEINFRLFSRDPKVIAQLKRQVKTEYLTTVTAIGADKTLIVTKESYFNIEHHVKQYLEILRMYETLFWDRQRSAFIYDGIVDEETGYRLGFVDLVLWKLMFDERIILYDDVLTYANNNYSKSVDRIYSSCPAVYVEEHEYQKSILYRIYSQDHKHDPAEFKYPQAYEPDPRVGKFTGKNLYYFERYGNQCDCNAMCVTCPTWDEEFVARLIHADPYPEIPLNSGYCEGCSIHCDGKPLTSYNPYLRNAIINWYNEKDIDWDNLELLDQKTCENYFLIPILLGAYQHFIHDLQR